MILDNKSLAAIRKLLTFDPEKRITVEQALCHPYLESLHFPDDEPVTTPVSMFDFEYERQILTMKDLKDIMYEEILLYHFRDKRSIYERNKAEYTAQHQSVISFIATNDESDEEMA